MKRSKGTSGNSGFFRRMSLRLEGYDYTQAGAYFITICTVNRECLLGEVFDGKMQPNPLGYMAETAWIETLEGWRNAESDACAVMPNHFHGIVIVGATQRVALGPTKRRPGPAPGTLGALIAQYKSRAAKVINRHRQTPGAPFWQRNYYDHVIRDEDDLSRIRQYIEENPAKWEEDENYPGKF